MKPLVLTMKAFGRYGKETTLDFQELKDNLFLITGDTGAGKTTIFDGISFALFGEASGNSESATAKKNTSGKTTTRASENARSFEMMHSDFVSKSEDTVIRLKFEHQGLVHEVERICHFSKIRGSQDYNEKGKISVTFWEAGKEPIEKNVNERIREIIGLDAGQFRRIVMLAQGQFKKFLEADGEEKNSILRKLFDSSDYVYFQSLLEACKKKIENQRKSESDKLAQALKELILPKDYSDQDKEAFSHGHDEMEASLEKLIAKNQHAYEEAENKNRLFDKQKTALTTKLAKGEENNKTLDELSQALKKKEELEKSMTSFLKFKKETEIFEFIHEKVTPLTREKERLERELAKNKNSILGLEQFLLVEEKKKEQKEKEYQKGETEKKTKINELHTKIENLKESLGKYQELGKKERDLQESNKTYGQEGKELQQVILSLEDREKQIKNLEKEEEANRDIGQVYVTFQNDYQVLEAFLKEFLDKNRGMKARYEKLKKQEERLELLKKELEDAIRRSMEAQETHNRMNKEYFAGQVARLSMDLNTEIQTKGMGICPVCHTRFNKGMGHFFVNHQEKVPSQKDLDAASDAMNEAISIYHQKEAEHEKEKETYRKDQEAYLAYYKDLMRKFDSISEFQTHFYQEAKSISLEEILEPTYLNQVFACYEKLRKDKAVKLEELEKKKIRQEEIQKKLPALRLEKERLEKDKEDRKTRINKLEIEMAGLQEGIKELKKSLLYESEEEAKKEENAMSKNKSKLEKDLENAKKELDGLKEILALKQGELAREKQKEPELKANLEKKETEILKVLGEKAPGSLDQAMERYKSLPDPAAWLSECREKINHYENACTNNKTKIKDLQEKTKDLLYVDITKLREDMEKLEADREVSKELENKTRDVYMQNLKCQEEIQKAREELKKTDRPWNYLNSLANLAVGENGDGGKLSFERFVMGFVFKEVLATANKYLDIMFGGRYQLEHEAKASAANKAAGLNIAVYDSETGESRKSASLSGGESFLVSLALALGLSDVVQNHAGGVKLDTLFVDEGFGSLDEQSLNRAMDVLNKLKEGNKLIGVISHVDKLENSISSKIHVHANSSGSYFDIIN